MPGKRALAWVWIWRSQTQESQRKNDAAKVFKTYCEGMVHRLVTYLEVLYFDLGCGMVE